MFNVYSEFNTNMEYSNGIKGKRASFSIHSIGTLPNNAEAKQIEINMVWCSVNIRYMNIESLCYYSLAILPQYLFRPTFPQLLCCPNCVCQRLNKKSPAKYEL